MSRINIEDSLFKDSRFFDLLIKCGCKYKALGIVTSAWILAQEHWLKYRSIPKKAWPKDLDILIEFKLAEKLENGDIYIKGSKNAFKWLEQKSDAGKKAKTSNEIKRPPALTDDNGRSTGGNGSNPLTPTLTLTPSLSLTLTQTQTHTLNTLQNEKKKIPVNKELNSKVWESYRDAYSARYGVEPVRNYTVNSKISQFAKRLGHDAIDVIKFYISHNDSFFIKNAHSIGIALSQAESLATQWKTGKQITQNEIRRFEKATTFQQMAKDAEKGGF